MARKWNAADFPADLPKPVITRTPARENRRGLRYTYRCKHKATGSAGYGYTPAHAYARWLHNYNRRRRFYTEREAQAQASLRAWPHLVRSK